MYDRNRQFSLCVYSVLFTHSNIILPCRQLSSRKGNSQTTGSVQDSLAAPTLFHDTVRALSNSAQQKKYNPPPLSWNPLPLSCASPSLLKIRRAAAKAYVYNVFGYTLGHCPHRTGPQTCGLFTLYPRYNLIISNWNRLTMGPELFMIFTLNRLQ